jgi:hypothetical protein
MVWMSFSSGLSDICSLQVLMRVRYLSTFAGISTSTRTTGADVAALGPKPIHICYGYT